MGYRAVLFVFLVSALQVQTVQGLDSVYVNCFNNILAKYSTASGIAVSNMYQYLDQAMSYFCLNIAADYRNCLTTNPAYPIDVLINKYFSMSDLMLTCLVKYRKQAGTNFVKCMMNPTLLSYNEKCVEDAVTRHNSNVLEESNAMQMISCVSGVFTNCTGFGIDMSDVPILFDLIFPEFKKNYTIANTDLKSVQCLFKTDMFTEQDFVTISDHVSDLTNSMNLKNILREIYLEFIPRLCDIGFKIKNETILTTFRECMVDSTTYFSNAVERTIMSCFKHTFVSETNANFFCAHVYKNHDGESACLEILLDYMVANLIISGMFNFIPAIISSPEGLDSTEGCNFCSSFGNFLLDQSNVLQYCSGGYAIEHSFLYSELQQCPANQTLSPTAPQATAPQTTSKPTEPPTTSKPTEPPTTLKPTAPQTTPAPTQPQTTPAPTQPQTTPAPTQSQTTPAPTQPQTTQAPTQPQTTPAPTQPQTTPAPTTSSTAKSSTTTSKTLSKSIKIITNADFSPFCPGGLFPYEGHDKHKLNDLSTPEIKIPCGLPACDTRYGSLFLNPNGYAALGSNYESNKPTYLTSSSHDMIAMYWYNMDISENGMYYKVYNVKNDDGTLDRISEVVRAKRKTVKKFDVIWALVVTWIRAKPKFGTGEITFQGIVATDGEKTFQVMNFYYSSLGDSSTEYPPVLGVKCSEKPRVRKRFTYNTLKTKVNTKKQLKKTIKAFQIHKYPKDCNGRFVYNRLSKKPPRIQHPQRGTKKCWKWYKAEMADLQRIKSFQLRVQTYCYCSKWMEQVASDSIENPYPHNRRNLQCFFITPPFGFDEAVECCYKRYSNAHIDYEPNMGSMVTIRTTKQKNDQFKKYRRENKYPRKWCCTKSDNCALYFKARPKPAYSCGVLSWFWIFWLFGDPHIITLDGRTYTFNGLGEYTLIKDQSNTFEIQARTCKALNKEGKEINATVFCGFAGKKDDGSSFQVLLDGNRENFKLRVNDDDYTSFYKSDEDFAVDFTNISAERNNESLQVSMSGLKLTFSIVSKTLKLDTSVSKNLTGLLKGLLGNFDGDDTNDFILPNGTDLPKKNHTEKELFYEFGQKWATTEASSIFYYDEGKSFTDYNDKNFIPLFAEDFSEAERDAAEANCTGEDNEVSNACVIDYLYTGDPGLAKSSGDTQSNVKNQTETLQNQQPLISGPSKMVFTVGQQVEFKVNGSDDGKFTYKIVNSPKTGSFALNETTGHGAWTANSDTNEEIQLTVIDDKGAEASPWTIKIFICKNCSGNGECDESKIEDYTDTYNVLPCTCNTGWEGDDCDKDIDACALSPCDPRQNCTDVSPTEHQATGVGHKCTACPSGYSESSNTCIDVNECNNAGTNTCDQLCVNTEGSYYCECKDGYRMVEETCKDINECEEVHDCEQQCLNTEGNSTCGCFMGFTLNNDKKACTKVADMCTPLGLNCDYACMNNTEGQVVCTCKNGYKLAADGKTCEDINECSTKLCSQTCNNTEGSFTCSCYDGYILQSDKLTCSTCDEEHWGPSCANDCECDGDGIEGCDPAFGCYCNDGYKGANCSEDRNECEEQPTICGQDKTCNNLDGSYECECLSGFIFDDNNENCIDIDECFEDEENADNEYENNCTTTSSTCENVAGGFTCKCKDGFKQKDMYTCEDIDECQQGANDCEQECVNRIPGFYCKCRAGFVLNDTDDKSCIQESNPCEGKTNKTCSYACHLVGTTAECYCKIGYKLASDQQTCIDIDECSNSTLNLCSEQDKCQNTEGGSTCSCSSGYFLDNDKRTCTGCDMFHYGDSCSKACNCHPLGADRCDPISGCLCNTGWAGSNCSSDLDECQGTNDCTHSNQECVNTFGSYECRCKSGYDNSTGSCKNIDECASGDSQCEQGCVDKDGSFTCTCPSGFQLNNDEQHCDDIDECAITSTCEQNCLNTDGGYMCYCNDGYKLNTTDRRQCYVETECSNGHGCQHNCALVNSVNVCSCKNGYALHSDNKTCNNIDECTTSKPCSDTCTDKDPGFNCSCPAGKYLSADTITCKDCDDGKYGANCSSSCSCATDNTETCDKVNGACTCKTGWKGTNCDVDVDECSSNSHSCQEHSTCNNTQGGYNCDCHTGYAPSSGIQCIECSGQKYGVNCENDCTCVIQNTEICNKINGICDCKSGWNGTRCESDINECQPNNPCTGGKECKNNDGSYTCKCASGYRENANGVCEDVDECYESQVCHKNADCDNVVGSYNCTCKALYIGDGITCSAPHVDNVVGGPNFDNGANDATSRLWYMLLMMTLLLNI